MLNVLKCRISSNADIGNMEMRNNIMPNTREDSLRFLGIFLSFKIIFDNYFWCISDSVKKK